MLLISRSQNTFMANSKPKANNRIENIEPNGIELLLTSSIGHTIQPVTSFALRDIVLK